jgi:hypothetical protein
MNIMAKEDPKEWDPSQPLEDEEEEETVSKTAKARARLQFLQGEELKKLEKKKKKGGLLDL